MDTNPSRAEHMECSNQPILIDSSSSRPPVIHHRLIRTSFSRPSRLLLPRRINAGLVVPVRPERLGRKRLSIHVSKFLSIILFIVPPNFLKSVIFRLEEKKIVKKTH